MPEIPTCASALSDEELLAEVKRRAPDGTPKVSRINSITVAVTAPVCKVKTISGDTVYRIRDAKANTYETIVADVATLAARLRREHKKVQIVYRNDGDANQIIGLREVK